MENKSIMYLSVIISSFFISKLVPMGDITLFVAVCAIFSKHFGLWKMCVVWSIPQLITLAEIPGAQAVFQDEMAQLLGFAVENSPVDPSAIYLSFTPHLSSGVGSWVHPILGYPSTSFIASFSGSASWLAIGAAYLFIIGYGWFSIWLAQRTFQKKGLYKRISF